MYGYCMENSKPPFAQTPDIWVPRIERTAGPLYLAIADAIAAAVADGTLRPGQRLPTHRALADRLSVDLTTVTRAYSAARERGLLDATVGRGTFVRAGRPSTDRGGVVDLGVNLPPRPEVPSWPDLLRAGLDKLLERAAPDDLFSYRSGAGTAEERVAGAAWLRPVLGDTDPERILLSPGAQPALMALFSVLAQPGDALLADELTYPGARAAAAQLGLQLVGVAGDGEGMLPDALEAACRRAKRARALYCIPTIQNPAATTMPPARRAALAEAARRCGLMIIEDDAHGLLPSTPLPAIASLAPDITFHVATLSKTLSPALRIAYLAVPDRPWAGRVAAALRAGTMMASPLLAGLASLWIRDGSAQAAVAAIRRECAARQKIARALLPAGSFAAHPEGLHLWLRLPAPWSRAEFVSRLRQQGMAIVQSDAFVVEGAVPPEAVRISLGAASDRGQLKAGLAALSQQLTETGMLPVVV